VATAYDTPVATIFPNMSYALAIRGPMQEPAPRNSAAGIYKGHGITSADYSGLFSVKCELLAATVSPMPLNATVLRLITAGLQAAHRRRVHCRIPLPVPSRTG